jgi:GntR family transcriptional regulator, transcriptional repressor for pyruvate dehydrogenase complex
LATYRSVAYTQPVAEARPYRLVPIRRVDIYREILAQIEAYIRENGLKAGDRLPTDRELAAMLGVSRPTVRMALKALESLGRLESRVGSGTYVRETSHQLAAAELVRGLPLDESFLRQLQTARNAIELQILQEAFKHRTPRNLARVQAVLEARANRLAADSEEGSLDLSFEVALGEICGNEVLRRLQSVLHEVWVQALVTLGEAPGDKFLMHREHLPVFDRFREGDLAGALARFRDHLDMVPVAPRSRRARRVHEA